MHINKKDLIEFDNGNMNTQEVIEFLSHLDHCDFCLDQMMEQGLLEETRRLSEDGIFEKNRTAAQAIGYKELFPWLDGRATRAEAVEALKTATRRYAKRQTTWFAARPYVTWVDADAGDRARNFEDIVNNAESLFS